MDAAHVKAAAQSTVKRALESGRLPPPSGCEACGRAPYTLRGGRSGLEYHHADYSRPLDVIPLCQSCHRRVHFGHIPEPRTGRLYPRSARAAFPAVAARVRDVLAANGPTTVDALWRQAGSSIGVSSFYTLLRAEVEAGRLFRPERGVYAVAA